jgi:hypothetical protein
MGAPVNPLAILPTRVYISVNIAAASLDQRDPHRVSRRAARPVFDSLPEEHRAA